MDSFVGIDESVYGIRTHNPDMESFVIKGNFYKEVKRLKGKHYDFINADNVLEHVPEPLKFMDLIASLCDRETIVCITVPNDFSQMQKLAYKMGQIDSAFWVTKETSEHFSYFGTDSLEKLGNESGLQKVAMLSDFPVDMFLLHTETNYRKKDVGRECHAVGVRIENKLFKDSLENMAKLHEALALNGIGRDISLYFRLK